MREITPNPGYYQQIREFLPDNLQKMVDVMPDELASKTVDSLRLLCIPSPQFRTFKIMFWKALDLAIARKEQLTIEEACCGIVTEQVYFAFCNTTTKAAWLLAKEISYDAIAETYLHDILKKFAPILEKPIVDDYGNIDYKLFEAQLKLYDKLDKRLHGNYIQKIEEKSLRLTGKDVAESKAKGQTYEEQISNLKKQLDQSQNAGGQGFIDVNKVEDTQG